MRKSRFPGVWVHRQFVICTGDPRHMRFALLTSEICICTGNIGDVRFVLVTSEIHRLHISGGMGTDFIFSVVSSYITRVCEYRLGGNVDYIFAGRG